MFPSAAESSFRCQFNQHFTGSFLWTKVQLFSSHNFCLLCFPLYIQEVKSKNYKQLLKNNKFVYKKQRMIAIKRLGSRKIPNHQSHIHKNTDKKTANNNGHIVKNFPKSARKMLVIFTTVGYPPESGWRTERSFSARRRFHRVPQIRPTPPLHSRTYLRPASGGPQTRAWSQAPAHARRW